MISSSGSQGDKKDQEELLVPTQKKKRNQSMVNQIKFAYSERSWGVAKLGATGGRIYMVANQPKEFNFAPSKPSEKAGAPRRENSKRTLKDVEQSRSYPREQFLCIVCSSSCHTLSLRLILRCQASLLHALTGRKGKLREDHTAGSLALH